jgi:hypothetical protein
MESLTMLPPQMASRSAWTPEQRLMAAVLEEALRCLQGKAYVPGRPLAATDRQRRRLPVQQAATRWFASQETAWPFSFENICAALGLDADTLRRRLRSTLPGTRYRPAA